MADAAVLKIAQLWEPHFPAGGVPGMGDRASFADLALQLPLWVSKPGQHWAAILVQSPEQPPGGGRPARPHIVVPSRQHLHLAGGAGCGQWLGSLRLGADGGEVWGFSFPGGLSRQCAEQTFGPDVGNMRNQFSGNSAAKPSTFGREAGLLGWAQGEGGSASSL